MRNVRLTHTLCILETVAQVIETDHRPSLANIVNTIISVRSPEISRATRRGMEYLEPPEVALSVTLSYLGPVP